MHLVHKLPSRCSTKCKTNEFLIFLKTQGCKSTSYASEVDGRGFGIFLDFIPCQMDNWSIPPFILDLIQKASR